MVNPQCQRCRMTFDTRKLLRDHSESLHGDYMQSRTRQEYLNLRRDRGDDLTTAKQIPVINFMSVSKLKSLVRAGKAESDLYSVRVTAAKKRRKQKVNCPGCGEPLDPKYGKKYHKNCKPSAYKKKEKPNKPKSKHSALIKGKRRKRCAAPDCDVMFYPESKRQRFHSTACANRTRSRRLRVKV